MGKLIGLFRKMGMAVAILSIIGPMGCQGSDTRKDVDDAVEEMVGKKNVDRMNNMKREIEEIQDQELKRLNQLDDQE